MKQIKKTGIPSKRMLSVLLFLVCLPCVLSVAAAQNIVSLHKGYELVTPASEGYPDAGGELTDGKYGTPIANGDTSYYYRDGAYVGFHRGNANADGNFVIVLDLGEQLTELGGFELSYLNETDVGIFAPVKVAFYVSDSRSGSYTFAGEKTLEVSVAAGRQQTGVVQVVPESGLSGRFVLCVITPRGTYTDENGQEKAGTWTFIDELTVLQGRVTPQEGEPEPSSPPPSDGTNSVPTSEPSEADRPQTGDRTLLCFVILCGVSGLATAALIGRRTR